MDVEIYLMLLDFSEIDIMQLYLVKTNWHWCRALPD